MQKHGREELPHSQGQGRQPRALGYDRWHRRAERSYSTFKVRRGDLIQGKEQWLCFAGAAMKRYLTFKVRETQVGWSVL